MCGEQFLPDLPCKSRIGSPPRVRGTKSITHGSSTDPRITPACAGNRVPQAPRRRLWRDHPRVCGEQSSLNPPNLSNQGSPPRVRGTDSESTTANWLTRITPACAGNRGAMDYQEDLAQDHPRVCGEQGLCYYAQKVMQGSPPRVRGTEIKWLLRSNP